MLNPQLYGQSQENAINCFCPRTAWKMRRLVEKYLLNGERPYINKRMGETPAAVLRLIFNNINQTAQLNCAIKLRNQVEEERKEKNRDGKNTASLPPGPSIIDTREGENIKDKEEEKGYISRTHAQENFQDQTNGEKNLHPNEILHPNENEENSNENENDRKGLNPLAARGAEDPTGKIAAARAEKEKITWQRDHFGKKALDFFWRLSFPARGKNCICGAESAELSGNRWCAAPADRHLPLRSGR